MNYLLILLVLTVWGLIIYRIVAKVSDRSRPLNVPQDTVKEPYDDYALPRDTTSLQSGYRDPFGLVAFKDTSVSKKTPAVHIRARSSAPGINWEQIRYLGYIRNPGSRKLIAIMHINGKELMMSEGESAEQLLLLKNLRDSIKINYRGQIKFITIKPAAL